MAIGNPINLTSNVEGKNISVIATAGQTQFTVTGGYRINQISVFRNGVRLVDGRDFTALDGSIVTLLSAATVADVIEFQVFDDFRVSDALNVNSGGTVNGNVTVTGILSTTNLSIGSSISLDATSGIVTAVQFIGQMTGTASTATEAEGLTGVPDITVNNIVAAAATFSGVVTYEDVTNIDSLGIVTARTGVDITANGLVVNAGVSTFAADLSIADKIVHTGDANTAIRFPSNDTFTVETSGVQRLEVNSTGNVGLVGIATATGLVVVAGSGVYAGHTGIITAVTFDGNVTGNISGGTVAGSTGTFTGEVNIADKIVHTGDTNTTIRFPSNDTFTVETTGVERLRVDSAGDVGLVGIATATGLVVVAGSGIYAGHTGIITAVTFDGNVTGNISGGTVAGSTGTFSDVVEIGGDANNGTAEGIELNTSGFLQLSRGSGVSALLAGYTQGSSTQTVRINNDGSATFKGDLTIADKIIHDGDTNTAIRFPAADTFTVETSGSEAIRIDSSQRLLLGDTSVRAVGTVGPTESKINIETPNSISAGLNIVWNRSGDDYGPRIRLGKSRTATVGGSTIVQDGDELGTIQFCGADGTDLTNLGAKIQCKVDGTPGSNDMPGRLMFSTSADGSGSPTERLRITSAGNVRVPDNGKFTCGAGDDLQIYHNGGSANYIDVYNKDLYIRCNLDAGITGGDIVLQPKSGENSAIFKDDGAVELYYDNSKKFETTSTGVTVTGGVSDSKGELRTIPQNSKSTAYTLVAADAGKHVLNTADVTVPASVFAAGNAITIINGSGSNINITQGSGATIYYTADGTSGSRVLAARGMASMLFVNSTDCYISGAGLS